MLNRRIRIITKPLEPLWSGRATKANGLSVIPFGHTNGWLMLELRRSQSEGPDDEVQLGVGDDPPALVGIGFLRDKDVEQQPCTHQFAEQLSGKRDIVQRRISQALNDGLGFLPPVKFRGFLWAFPEPHDGKMNSATPLWTMLVATEPVPGLFEADEVFLLEDGAAAETNGSLVPVLGDGARVIQIASADGGELGTLSGVPVERWHLSPIEE